MTLNLTKLNCITLKIRSKAEFMSKSPNIWQQIILLCTTVMQMICAWPTIWTLSGRQTDTGSKVILFYISNNSQWFLERVENVNIKHCIKHSSPWQWYGYYFESAIFLANYIKVIELVDNGYKMRFRHIQVCSTGIRAYGNRN
jgi:hypothetical protein